MCRSSPSLLRGRRDYARQSRAVGVFRAETESKQAAGTYEVVQRLIKMWRLLCRFIVAGMVVVLLFRYRKTSDHELCPGLGCARCFCNDTQLGCVLLALFDTSVTHSQHHLSLYVYSHIDTSSCRPTARIYYLAGARSTCCLFSCEGGIPLLPNQQPGASGATGGISRLEPPPTWLGAV